MGILQAVPLTLVSGLDPVFHTIVVLFQTITLNVAVNSHSKALLTIMVSNNFVELKGSVFKKFERNNLFQMSCSGEGIHVNVYTCIY